jgi:ketosteroid isomerase-like protein
LSPAKVLETRAATSGYRDMLLMMLVMTLLMGIVLSAFFTWQAVGFATDFVAQWMRRFVSTYAVVLPTVLIVAPAAQRIAKWLGAVLIPTPVPSADTSSSSREIALEALRHNARGHRGEGFDDWYRMLDDRVSITMPIGAFRGENIGIERARNIYEAIAMASPRLTYEIRRVVERGDTIVVEFDSHGSIAGMAYSNRIAGSFDVQNGRIAAYREYFGDIDQKIVAMMTNAEMA